MTVRLRMEVPADKAFIRNLVLATVAIELGATAWPEPMRSHLLEIQYSGRVQNHGANYPGSESFVIQSDGLDVGWLRLNESDDEVRLVEIMVAPESRGQGIGAAAILGVLDRGAAAGKPVHLSVNALNAGAIRLYELLGFRRVGGDEVQHLMEWVS